ncbi:OLC1v1018481C1 [Oldenlandia corymbosa var. corymbosa]|uniref:OLC1v1018481C1 n=1 Tax=Oldenlandia corymbosa var. corymbosa TaxID=529605 RepID=A0AAV1EBR2_OLDCO|nr:OLC1v1018481C1 [Oldenlandia corymbosa var. corymbosa]
MAVAEDKIHSDVLLFNRWSYDDVQISDMSVEDYITATSSKHPVYIPHTAGRYQAKRFRKAQCPIVERLTNSLMMHGRNNGKKLMAVRIVKHAMEIIHLLTDENPIQIIVNAVINSGPREDATRIGSAGVVRRQAVDISPLRRVNQAIYLLTTGARESAFRNIKTIAECLADELINAAKGSSNSYAIKKKDEIERVAKANLGNSGHIIIDGHSSSSPQMRRCFTPCCSRSSNAGEAVLDSGSSVVRKFYEGINARDLSSVENLISENCVYEDLVFPQPFVGRKAILDFFKKFIDTFSADLQFVIDDLSKTDDSAVGVTWHLEWKGKPFPFSKGCSFYKLEVVNGQRQILIQQRDVDKLTNRAVGKLLSTEGITKNCPTSVLIKQDGELQFTVR